MQQQEPITEPESLTRSPRTSQEELELFLKLDQQVLVA